MEKMLLTTASSFFQTRCGAHFSSSGSRGSLASRTRIGHTSILVEKSTMGAILGNYTTNPAYCHTHRKSKYKFVPTFSIN